VKFTTGTSKFLHFAKIKKKNVITSKLKFFRIFVIFQACFVCFVTANATNKKSNKQMNKLFWWLYFIISQRFAHLFKWASSGKCFQPQNI